MSTIYNNIRRDNMVAMSPICIVGPVQLPESPDHGALHHLHLRLRTRLLAQTHRPPPQGLPGPPQKSSRHRRQTQHTSLPGLRGHECRPPLPLLTQYTIYMIRGGPVPGQRAPVSLAGSTAIYFWPLAGRSARPAGCTNRSSGPVYIYSGITGW